MNVLPNLLIVDDTKLNLRLIETIIKDIRINVIKTLSGAEALKKTKGIELALAIIDVHMPKMSGYELAIKLNEDRKEAKVPIIFVTANHFDKVEEFKGYDSGAVDYIFKPINDFILQSKIKVFLDLYNQKQIIIQNSALLEKFANELSSSNLALRESEEKFRGYVNNAPNGIFVTDETGKYLDVNKAASKITGYSGDELLTMSLWNLLTEDSLKEAQLQFEKLINTGSLKSDLAFNHKNGAKRWWTLEAVRLSVDRFLCFTKDITIRKEMEEAMKVQQSELEKQNEKLTVAIKKVQIASEKYAELYNFAPTGYLTLSPEKIIQDLNHSGVHILGKERSQLINIPFDKFISRQTLPVFNDFFKNIFESNTKGICEIILNKVTTPPKYLHIEGMVAGNGEQCLINVVDITERKQAEKALEEGRKKYKIMLEASPDGILIINLRGIIEEISEIGLELLGASKKGDVIGKHYLRFVPSEEQNTIQGAIEKTMSEGIAQNIEITIRKINQSLFLSEVSLTLIQTPDGAISSFMITIRDISLRKKMEKKQIHADRMASLGEMASGIAHEINQPLNTISLVMDNILYECSKDKSIGKDYLQKKIEKIFENIIRIKNIIDHIRAFSRNHDEYISTGLDINTSIRNALTMISEQLKHQAIELNLQLLEKPPLINGNTFKFEQVILNLLLNAKDALLEKKEKQPAFSNMFIGIKSFLENQNMVIEITDNGTGISEEDVDYIMLPFYTTKDTGKGTGLGLPISYQIIKEMNGNIEIISSPSIGTTFKIVIKVQNK